MAESDETKIIDKFLNTLKKCLQEYRKQQAETRGTDEDIAHFFDSSLKTWVKKNKYQIVTLLGGMNFERPFVTFVKNYLLKDENKPYQRSIQSQVNEVGEREARKDMDRSTLNLLASITKTPQTEMLKGENDEFIQATDSKFIQTLQQIGPPQQKRRGLL